MIKKKRIVIIIASSIALIVFLIVLSGGYFLWQLRRCLITVENLSGHNITSITLTVRGSSYGIGKLESGQAKTVRVYPHGESSVELFFVGTQSKSTQWKGGYIDQCGGYRMGITIGLNDKVTQKTELWP